MNYKIEHIGYLTGNIENTASKFKSLGYHWGGVIYNDDRQQCRIGFMEKPDEVRIELVEPYDDNEPMLKMLKKKGVSPYHVCYEVDDVDVVLNELNEEGWLPLFARVPAPAFDNRLICYMFKQEIGYVEFVNKK